MLTNYLEIFYQIKIPLLGFFIFLVFLTKFWIFIFNISNLKPYNEIQRVHENEVPRLGGIVIYLFLWVLSFTNFIEEKIFFNLLISATPFVLVSFKEDLFHRKGRSFNYFGTYKENL